MSPRRYRIIPINLFLYQYQYQNLYMFNFFFRRTPPPFRNANNFMKSLRQFSLFFVQYILICMMCVGEKQRKIEYFQFQWQINSINFKNVCRSRTEKNVCSFFIPFLTLDCVKTLFRDFCFASFSTSSSILAHIEMSIRLRGH